MENLDYIPFGKDENFRSRWSRVLSRPKIIDFFSVDGDKNYVPGSSKLKYFIPPKSNFVNFNLDSGREVAVCNEDLFKETGVSLLLKWIESNREKIKASPETDRLIEPNFVSTHGLLVRFMTAPYSPNDSWRVWAGKWKGTIYIRSDKTYGREEAERDQKFGFWGHKFQQYLVSESPFEAPNTARPVVRHEEFYGVYQHQFSEYSVLYPAVRKAAISKEVLRDPLPLDTLKFIDLRTNKIIEHGGHEKTLKKHKFLAWWASAFLTNDDQVLCGFRDSNGIVNKLNTYETDQMVKKAKFYWNPEECIRCCETLLWKIAKTVVDECDETIYELTKKSHEDFDITELKPSEENCGVPEWYKNSMSP